MPLIGPHQVPFPFPPYELQEHAVTELRNFLDAGAEVEGDDDPSTPMSRDQLNFQRYPKESEPTCSPRVAVLESPTGTGKSHILLSSVLSHLFTPVYPSTATTGEPARDPKGNPAVTSSKAVSIQQLSRSNKTLSSDPSKEESSSTSLQEVLRQRQLDELIEQLKSERKERIKQNLRQLRAAKKRLAAQASIPTPDDRIGGDGIEDFLIPQHQLEASTPGVDGVGSAVFPLGAAKPTTLRYNSSSSSSRSTSSSSDSEEATPYLSMEDLAGLLPLRKPKAYFASRTHTQLQQLFNDLYQTDFVRYPIQTREVKQQAAATSATTTEPAAAAAGEARALRAVHVAGRQQLCINASLQRKAAGLAAAGAPADALNELCLEAMRFEHSPAGRTFRRQADARAAAAGPAPLPPLQDLEELGGRPSSEQGCAYCATQRLHTLLRHLQPQRLSGDAEGTARPLSLPALKQLGEEFKACPYLATRLLVRGADVVMIPYSYLAEEGQRDALLGGAATNPLTDEEHLDTFERAAAVALLQRQDAKARGANPFDLGHDRSPSGSRCGTNNIAHAISSKAFVVKPVSTALQRQAHPGRLSSAAPGACFTADVVVIDEAHNIADYCRAVSTAALCDTELRIVSFVLQEYLKRYESRLLTKNKQRLREILLFLHKLIQHAGAFVKQTQAEGDLSSGGGFGCGPGVHTAVQTFSTFLFEADLAHIDVFEFLEFLRESRLIIKLQGFTASMLTQEVAAAAVAASHEAGHKKLRMDSSRKGKAREDGVCARAREGTPFLEFLATCQPTPRETSSSHSAAAVPVPEVVCPAVTRALRRFEHFLQVFYNAGDATRVLLTPTGPSPFGFSLGSFLLKLLPLDPGRHTLAPLLAAAHAVVLAGGTMQPLSLSCAPLLPPSLWDAVTTTTKRTPTVTESTADRSNGLTKELTKGLAAVNAQRREPFALISEPHVVPASAIAVWALAAGPSGRRMEFGQRALTAAAQEGLAASVMFTELAMTLLNLCRVLPPAGVICFFTSYEIAHNFTTFLRESGYYAQIDAVKRIFVEGQSVKSQTTTASTHGGEKRERVHPELPSRLEDNADDDLPQSPLVMGAGIRRVEEEAAEMNNRGVEALLAEYRAYVLGSERGQDGVRDSPNCHSSTGKNSSGALLFAVMGGRLSEGINFSDDLGRAVLVVGIPYANPTDLELQLNLRHIAMMNVAGGKVVAGKSVLGRESYEGPSPSISTTTAATTADGGSSNQLTERRLTQAQWELYTDLCMRTVNQCIGRCIRHSQDYAAVVLLDARYVERVEIRRRLPGWIQPSFKIASNFGECFRGVRSFFTQR